MTAAAAIEVDSLDKIYRSGRLRRGGFHALRGVSFQVQPGQIFGLLGPNGAGKTTVIKVLLGIVRKSGGRALLLGRPAGWRAGRHNIGYLPENLRIAPHHTARTALEYYGRLSGLSTRDVRQQLDRRLEMVGLDGWAETRVRKFSKGMVQRLGLAQALLHDPDLLILDEPTDGLDPVARNAIRELLVKLRGEGKTVFLNSHLLQEVERVCDQVGILDQGQVRFVGRIDEITRPSISDEVQLELAGAESEARAALDQFEGLRWQAAGDGRLHVTLALPDQDALDSCIDGLRQHGISILQITRRRATLEDAFLDLIGRDDR